MPAIFQYDFMIRALIGGVLVGGLAPALGMFLVLRRFSLIADTLAHVALMGVAIGLATNIYPSLVTFLSVTAGALLIEFLRSRGKLPGDVVLAVVLYTTLAVAVVVVSTARGFNVDLLDFLFGSILSMTTADVWYLGLLAAAVAAVVTMFFIEIAQSSFDDELARVAGMPVNRVNLVLAILTAATITLSMRIVGVLLVGALMVVPVLAGQSLVAGLRAALGVAVLVGMLSAVSGLTIAFYADLPAGGAIVISATSLLILAHLTSLAWAFLRRGRTKPIT